jgi:hypothetical protein
MRLVTGAGLRSCESLKPLISAAASVAIVTSTGLSLAIFDQ